jgi:hypothetical protein
MIVDDFLDESHQDLILSRIDDPHFIWTDSCDHTVGYQISKDFEHDERFKESPQLVSLVMVNQTPSCAFHKDFTDVLKIFLEKNNWQTRFIHRIKVNHQDKDTSFTHDMFNTPHVDWNFPHNVMIYYAMDSDGDTALFDFINGEYVVVERVTPKKGRAVLFDGSVLHAGRPPSINDRRLVINYNFR